MTAETALLNCKQCPRLADFLHEVAVQNPGYFCKPVQPFGVDQPRLLVVGLAPGMHGANRTGRPFTGDHAGILLYETLHAYGFANRPQSVSADDGLQLIDCRITNAVKCLPPQNKPLPIEIRTCNTWLSSELADWQKAASNRSASNNVIVALGSIAHESCLRAAGHKAKAFTFAHGAEHAILPGITLIDSYHCSRYNTQTRRLTPDMFHSVFARARELVDGKESMAKCGFESARVI